MERARAGDERAFAELTDPYRRELQDFTKASIAPYKYPRVIEFVSELPKTISGKTQRYRLRQMAGAKLQARSG